MFTGKWLRIGHVKGGTTDFMIAECLNQRVCFDESSPANIYQHRFSGKRRQFKFANQSFRGFGKRTGEHKVVCRPEHRFELGLVESNYLIGWAALLRRVPYADRFDIEPVQTLDNGLADCAQPNNRYRRILQFVGLVVTPLIALLATPPLVKPSCKNQYIPDDMLGYIGPMNAGSVRHCDALLGK